MYAFWKASREEDLIVFCIHITHDIKSIVVVLDTI